MIDPDHEDELWSLVERRRIEMPLVTVDVEGAEYAVLKDGTLGGLAPDYELGPRSGEKAPAETPRIVHLW